MSEGNVKDVKEKLEVKEVRDVPDAKDVVMKSRTEADIVAEVTTKFFEQFKPFMEAVSKNQQGAVPTQAKADPIQTVSDVRSKVIKDMEKQFQATVRANNSFAARMASLKPEDLTTVRIPRIYRKYFGPYIPVGINGVVITIPIDNQYHKIPKLYLPILERALNYEDEKIDFMERTDKSDVLGASNETLGN